MVNAEARTFAIGKLVDSADDTARLMIITQYAGTMTVKVYASDGIRNAAASGTLGSDGRININPSDNADDDVFVTLKSEGMYYLASARGIDAAALEPMSPDADNLLLGDTVAGGEAKDWAKPVEVFSHTPSGGTPMYVVLTGTSTDETTGVTTVTYATADYPSRSRARWR